MRRIFQKSLELAWEMYPSNFDDKGCRCFHVSILFDKTKVLAIAENQQKTHPRNLRNVRNFDVSLKNQCSELNLFISAKNKLNKVNWQKLTVVNVRIDQQGNVKNSHPCNACQNLIKYLNARNIYYTNDNGEFEQYKLN